MMSRELALRAMCPWGMFIFQYLFPINKFSSPNPEQLEIFDSTLSIWLCVGVLTLYFKYIHAETCLALCGLAAWTLGSASFYDNLVLKLEVGVVFALAALPQSPAWAFPMLALGFNVFAPSFSFALLCAIAFLQFYYSNVLPMLMMMAASAVAVGMDMVYFDYDSPQLAIIAIASMWIGNKQVKEQMFGWIMLILTYVPRGMDGIGEATLLCIVFAITRRFNSTFTAKVDAVWFMLPMVRSTVMPFPGVFRIDNVIADSMLTQFSLQLALFSIAMLLVRKHSYIIHELFLFALCTSILPSMLLVGVANELLFAVLLCCAAGAVALRSNPTLKTSVLAFVWLASLFAMLHLTPTYNLRMLDKPHAAQYCRNQALLPSSPSESWWIKHKANTRLAVDKLHAMRTSEPPYCRTSFPTPIQAWQTKRIAVLGDSIGRFLFYSLANELVGRTYGFPPAAYHGNIKATDKLHFYWSPHAAMLPNVTQTLAFKPDVMIISVGLWDKLRKHNVTRYEEEIFDFISRFELERCKLVWLEMTPCVDSNLPENKIEFLAERTANEWRQAARRAVASHASIIPSHKIALGRKSADGVHYDMFTYQAITKVILRGV